MKVGKDKVVLLYYIFMVDGEKVESLYDCDEVLWVLFGYGQLILGLEMVLEGYEVGELLQVDVVVVDGYGECQEGQIQCVLKKYFQQVNKFKLGMIMVFLFKQGGQCVVIVYKVGMIVVDVDFNYLMVGKMLYFDVIINEVCDGMEEEIQYGYVYLLGGEVY